VISLEPPSDYLVHSSPRHVKIFSQKSVENSFLSTRIGVEDDPNGLALEPWIGDVDDPKAHHCETKIGEGHENGLGVPSPFCHPGFLMGNHAIEQGWSLRRADSILVSSHGDESETGLCPP
jgi:hypothetical protein